MDRPIANTDRRGVLVQTSKLMAATVVSLFFVAACAGSGGTPTSAPPATTEGGGATAAPTSRTADPCTLLTQADIKAATGVDYGPSVADGYGHCQWFFGTSMVNEGKGAVTVSFASTGTTLESIKAGPFAGGVDTTVSGHPAYWSPMDAGPGIWVDLGTSVLVVGIDPVPAGGQAIAEHLAALAVAKL
jgi:Protein of unknown function (DUF3558)